MKKYFYNPWAALTMIALMSVALWAQNPGSNPPAQSTPPPAKAEGVITTGLSTSGCGMPSFTLKTKEGKEIAIHLGTLKESGGKVFIPKTGESISVVGATCCEMGGQSMIHATEITWAESTYRGPAGPNPAMMPGMGMMMGHNMTGQGPMGPGMMGPGQMGSGMMGQGMNMAPGQPGQGMQGTLMCPGMTGQSPTGTAQVGPGGTCPGCGAPLMQHAPATPAAPAMPGEVK